MFEIEVQVDYADTDAMAVAHHSRYFRWLERARIEWLRSEGHSYAEMENEGLALPLLGATIEFLRPLRFDERFRVSVRVEEMSRASIKLFYELTRNGELLTRATTSHIVCRKKINASGAVEWVPTRLPEAWREKWAKLAARKSSTSR